MVKQHIERPAKYDCCAKGVKSIPAPVCNGYPVKIDTKKTVKVRGTGAALRGTMATSKLG